MQYPLGVIYFLSVVALFVGLAIAFFRFTRCNISRNCGSLPITCTSNEPGGTGVCPWVQPITFNPADPAFLGSPTPNGLGAAPLCVEEYGDCSGQGSVCCEPDLVSCIYQDPYYSYCQYDETKCAPGTIGRYQQCDPQTDICCGKDWNCYTQDENWSMCLTYEQCMEQFPPENCGLIPPPPPTPSDSGDTPTPPPPDPGEDSGPYFIPQMSLQNGGYPVPGVGNQCGGTPFGNRGYVIFETLPQVGLPTDTAKDGRFLSERAFTNITRVTCKVDLTGVSQTANFVVPAFYLTAATAGYCDAQQRCSEIDIFEANGMGIFASTIHNPNLDNNQMQQLFATKASTNGAFGTNPQVFTGGRVASDPAITAAVRDKFYLDAQFIKSGTGSSAQYSRLIITMRSSLDDSPSSVLALLYDTNQPGQVQANDNVDWAGLTSQMTGDGYTVVASFWQDNNPDTSAAYAPGCRINDDVNPSPNWYNDTTAKTGLCDQGGPVFSEIRVYAEDSYERTQSLGIPQPPVLSPNFSSN